MKKDKEAYPVGSLLFVFYFLLRQSLCFTGIIPTFKYS